MSVHIFTVNEENYKICIERGIVGIPASNSKKTFDELLSRIVSIKENDYILLYVIGTKELRGVWQADGRGFYDEEIVWEDKLYPFRCKIKCSDYCFPNPLKLNDIIDLQNSGKIWTWYLTRVTGVINSMFSISYKEFEVLLNEFMKINPFTTKKARIIDPYRFHEYNAMDYVHKNNGKLSYESSVMSLLNNSFAENKFTDLFGNYSDYLSYVPTNFRREIDILLMFGNPNDKTKILSYDIIEVKRDSFDGNALTQLIDYESWFLQKKVSGDLNMIRTTAIAKSYTDEVIDYVNKRKQFENKPIKLLQYSYSDENGLALKEI